MQGKDEKGRFVKGNSFGRTTRKPRAPSFQTIFNKAVKNLSKYDKVNLKDPLAKMVEKAIIEAIKGDHHYYKDIFDRLCGKAKENIDMTVEATTNIAVIVDDVKRKQLPVVPEHNE